MAGFFDPKEIDCPGCYGWKGSGLCANCKGIGVEDPIAEAFGAILGVDGTCTTCNGTKECQTCYGKGYIFSESEPEEPATEVLDIGLAYDFEEPAPEVYNPPPLQDLSRTTGSPSGGISSGDQPTSGLAPTYGSYHARISGSMKGLLLILFVVGAVITPVALWPKMRGAIIETRTTPNKSPHEHIATQRSNTVKDAFFAYITNEGSNTVSVIDTATNRIVSQIRVGETPRGVAVHPAGTRIYVTNFRSRSVSVIDTTKNSVLANVSVGGMPNGIAMYPTGARLYVANNLDGTVSVIDTATNAVVANVKVGNRPDGIVVHPSGKWVYVVNKPDGTVSVINTATNRVTATVKVSGRPEGIALNPAGTRAYITNNNGTVLVLDTATNVTIATIPVQNFPTGVAVHPLGTRIYAAHFLGDSISVIDTTTNSLTATVKVGESPNGIAVHPLGTQVYVANHKSNTLSVIDTATNAVVATMNVGLAPVAFGQFVSTRSSQARPVSANSGSIQR